MRPSLFHQRPKARLSAPDEVRGVADDLMLSDAVTERRQIDPREHCLSHVAPVRGYRQKAARIRQATGPSFRYRPFDSMISRALGWVLLFSASAPMTGPGLVVTQWVAHTKQ
jgi:hypothetical protein